MNTADPAPYRSRSARGRLGKRGQSSIAQSVAERWLPFILASSAALLLLMLALVIRYTISLTVDLAVRGEGEAIAAEVHRFLKDTGRPLSGTEVDTLLLSWQKQGLTYLEIDDGTQPLASGSPGGIVRRPGLTQVSGSKVRLVHPLPPSENFQSARVRPSKGGSPPHLILEFEPLRAGRIEFYGNILFLVTLLVVVAILVLWVALTRALQHRERLQVQLERDRHLASLGEMSAVLAHELLNPITSLKGHAQLLVSQLPTASREQTKAARVVTEAVRLEHLAAELLEFVRSGELSFRKTDPQELLRAAAREADEGRIDLEVLSPIGLWDLDPGRLSRALLNILRNALQASRENGRVSASVAEQAGVLVFQVRDFGEGLPKGQEHRIFEPYFTTRTRGSGLGLAISREVVEGHGGSLTAWNHPEGGAVFEIQIPDRKVEPSI